MLQPDYITIPRNNFTSVLNIDDDQRQQHHRHTRVHEVKFFTNSALANEAFSGSTNPRILIIGKTVVSNCYSLPEGASNSYSGPKENAHGLTIDTLANKEKTIFYKFHSNEMYPEYVLVYRDVSGPKDAHTSRLTDFVRHCQLSYRSGTRYNPQEKPFEGTSEENETVRDDPNAIQVLEE